MAANTSVATRSSGARMPQKSKTFRTIVHLLASLRMQYCHSVPFATRSGRTPAASGDFCGLPPTSWHRLFTQLPIRGILGSPGRSKSQQLVSDSCNKRSIRGVAKGQKCLCPTRIGLGTGPRGGACYRELPRIPLLGNSVNKGKNRKGRVHNAPALVDTATLLRRTQGYSCARSRTCEVLRSRGHSSCLGYKRHPRSPRPRCSP